MNTSQNPPSLLSYGSGCTLTSCYLTSDSRRIRNGIPNKGEGTKNKKRHARYIRKFCEFGHATVPYGIGTQGHAVGTNQRGKGPSDCYSDEHTTCTGTKGQKLVSRMGGNFKKGLRQSPDTAPAPRNKCYPTLTSIWHTPRTPRHDKRTSRPGSNSEGYVYEMEFIKDCQGRLITSAPQ